MNIIDAKNEPSNVLGDNNKYRTSRTCFFNNLNAAKPDIPKPSIPVKSFIFIYSIKFYLNFNDDRPIKTKITAIIQNLITIVDSSQPFCSK